MFDGALKRRVDSLCRELSDFVANRPERFHGGGCESRHPGNGWPADPGPPDSTGSQNGVRYAYFAQACRLVIEVDGKATVHDTLDHRIGGCSQQPSEGGTPSFTSQHGRIDLASLPVISSDRARPRVPEPDGPIERPRFDDGPRGSAPSGDARELLATIEKIADLHARGILNDDEFAHKKVELLARL
ncbi:MAG TPA: SHOCT domain-containing protein [Variovorax sp.]|nr:SHOCT domain-containing protein [Variovorax sp.]